MSVLGQAKCFIHPIQHNIVLEDCPAKSLRVWFIINCICIHVIFRYLNQFWKSSVNVVKIWYQLFYLVFTTLKVLRKGMWQLCYMFISIYLFRNSDNDNCTITMVEERAASTSIVEEQPTVKVMDIMIYPCICSLSYSVTQLS